MNKGQLAVRAVRDYNENVKAVDGASLAQVLDILMEGAVSAAHFATPDPTRDDNVLCAMFGDGSHAVAVMSGYNGLDVFGHENSDAVIAFALGAANALGLERVNPGDKSKFFPPSGMDMPSAFSRN